MSTPQQTYAPTHQPPPAKKRDVSRWLIPVGTGLLGIIIGTSAAGGEDEARAEAPAVSTEAEATPDPEPAELRTTIGEGTWTVGVDVAPGTYRSESEITDSCYWQLIATGTNGDDVLNADNLRGGFATVTVEEGQDIRNSCGPLVLQP